MGLMFARRRVEAKKEHDANKAKAHADNSKKVLAAQKPEKAVKENASDKPGAK